MALRPAAAPFILAVGVGLWLIASSRDGRPAIADEPRDRAALRPATTDDAPARGTPPPELPRSELPSGQTPATGDVIARIRIPSIDVDAPVIRLGLNADRSLQVPADARQTGWWSGGPLPGERGPAVIVGHVVSRGGPAVFFRLGELEPGDDVQVVRASGETARFRVSCQEKVAKDDFPTRRVYGQAGKPALRLITCAGAFDESRGRYPDNLIVFARQAPRRASGPRIGI